MQRLTMTDADYGELAKTLRKVDFFAPMTIGQLDMILPYILLCSYTAGSTVFKQGAAGDAFYIIRRGKVSVRLRKLLLFSKEVAQLGPGDFFGEMALMSPEGRTATVTCLDDCHLFVLLSRDFKFVLQKNPQFAEEVRKIAEQRKFMSRNSGN